LSHADLRDADLWGADLFQAVLVDCDLRGARLWGADLRRANLLDSRLDDAYLMGAKLQGANLGGVSAVHARFASSQLDSVDLSGANLTNARFWGSSLRSVRVSHTTFTRAQVWVCSLDSLLDWKSITAMSFSSIYGAQKAPMGFLVWAQESMGVDTEVASSDKFIAMTDSIATVGASGRDSLFEIITEMRRVREGPSAWGRFLSWLRGGLHHDPTKRGPRGRT
jgi:hypothetical protein